MSRTLHFLLSAVLMMSVTDAATAAADASAHTEHFTLTSAAFGVPAFHITVYLPPDYAEGAQRYPVLYANDGQDMAAVGLPGTLATLEASHSIRPLIVVAVDALPDRLGIYGLSDRARRRSVVGGSRFGAIGTHAQAYSDWVARTLVPWIDTHYRTQRKPAGRAMLGWSLGALHAFNLGWNYADVFGTVGAFSPSFWVAGDRSSAAAVQGSRLAQAMVDRGVKRSGLRLWFSIGTGEETSDRDGDGVIDAVDDLGDLIDGWQTADGSHRRGLRQLGYRVASFDPARPPPDAPVVLDVVPGAQHNQQAWAQVLPDFLRWAFPPLPR
jgi:enterochelin esterase-like enzyme